MPESSTEALGSETAVVLLMDTGPQSRQSFVYYGSELSNAKPDDFVQVTSKTLFSGEAGEKLERAKKIALIAYPTRTYSEGMGGSVFSSLSPEDRALIRKLQNQTGKKLSCYQVDLSSTEIWQSLPEYLTENEKEKCQNEAKTQQTKQAGQVKKSWIGFDLSALRQVAPLFKSCMTRPNKQDFFYLVTKTFGLNLAMRVIFAAKGVGNGELALERAFFSTAWYQLQDTIFTIFGQTYMKFLGKLTGLLRIGNAYIGDFFLVYIQFCFLEFLNRLILGPLGENPLAYTWQGIGLILLNNFQGMISGGPIVPAINKMRRAGLISHSTMMHFYQISSLLMYSGLFATFGYQSVYFVITTVTLILAWGSYIFCSVNYKDIKLESAQKDWVAGGLDRAVGMLYSPLK